MKTSIAYLLGFTLLSTLFATSLHAAALRGNNEHARKWNKFADDVLALHNKLVEQKKTTVKRRLGGYFQNENFYKEEAYYDAANNKLISRVQWEREQPDNLHIIEVFIRDDQGRVTRDYIAAYLPNYRNAPTQTLVSLHAYNGKLHAFRSFDATSDLILERCTGKLHGREVNLLLDEDEIYEALEGDSDVMEQTEYKACFKGMPNKVGKYLTPQ